MRIPPVTPETLTPDQKRVYDAVVAGPRGKVQGPLLALLHVPELADAAQKLGEYVRYRTCLPPKLNELAILVTARGCNSQVEWSIHAPIARKAGLAASIVDDIARGRRPAAVDADERAIHDFAREMQERKTVSAPAYQAVLDRWGIRGVVELSALIGYYTMVAMTLNAHEIPVPAGVEASLPEP